eukprot:29720-Pelagococcus_subviridis.AAC.3
MTWMFVVSLDEKWAERDAGEKVFKDRRSHRERGRTGTSASWDAPARRRSARVACGASAARRARAPRWSATAAAAATRRGTTRATAAAAATAGAHPRRRRRAFDAEAIRWSRSPPPRSAPSSRVPRTPRAAVPVPDRSRPRPRCRALSSPRAPPPRRGAARRSPGRASEAATTRRRRR